MSIGTLLGGLLQTMTPDTPKVIDLGLSPPCQAAPTKEAEVVVCGRRDSERGPYRLPPPTDTAARPKAEAQIADRVSIAGETENAEVGGRPSKRLMVRLKIRF